MPIDKDGRIVDEHGTVQAADVRLPTDTADRNSKLHHNHEAMKQRYVAQPAELRALRDMSAESAWECAALGLSPVQFLEKKSRPAETAEQTA